MAEDGPRIVPLKGHFESPKAMLHHIAEDDEIDRFVIVVFRKDGTAVPAHINCERRDMAFAGAVLFHRGVVDDD